MIIDVYHPLVSSNHQSTCAALCTNYPWPEPKQPTVLPVGRCLMQHTCWCPDGALSYAEFEAKHPDVTVAETEGIAP